MPRIAAADHIMPSEMTKATGDVLGSADVALAEKIWRACSLGPNKCQRVVQGVQFAQYVPSVTTQPAKCVGGKFCPNGVFHAQAWMKHIPVLTTVLPSMHCAF